MFSRLFICICLLTFIPIVSSAKTPPGEYLILTPSSLGSVKIGMDMSTAARLMKVENLFSTLGRLGNDYCYPIHSSQREDQMRGIQFDVEAKQAGIARIVIEYEWEGFDGEHDLIFTPKVETKEGLRIGDPVSKIASTYGRNKSYHSPQTLSAHYVLVRSLIDASIGYAFESDGEIIVGMRAGKLSLLRHPGRCE